MFSEILIWFLIKDTEKAVNFQKRLGVFELFG